MPHSKRPSFIKRKNHTGNPEPLGIERLEDRLMLSTVEIFAAGSTGQENLDLFIDGEFETTFFEVGGDVDSRQFQRFVFETDRALTPGNVGIGFGNDAFDSLTGFDRNLLVDRIVVDGVTVETEDPTTFGTGVFQNGTVVGPGNLQTEFLNINAIFTFADPVSGGDRVEFDALGTTGEEVVNLVVAGDTIASFGLTNPGQQETFSFETGRNDVGIEDVRIEFINDLVDAERGLDRNVLVSEFRVIDSETGQSQSARTTDANVINLGIYVEGQGITSGFGAGGFLAGNGFVEISEVPDPDSTTSLVPDLEFQESTGVFVSDPAIGPDNQVAAITFSGFVNVVGENGVPVSSFGNNGQVNLNTLLGPFTGFSNPDFDFSDVEFFDDGSLLVVGTVTESGFNGGQSVSSPVVAKLNADGTLDGNFSQGIVTGTFLQLIGFTSSVGLEATIDSQGRVVVLGLNRGAAQDSNLVVFRLNPDGGLDSSFGNNGNVFIAASSLGEGPFGQQVTTADPINVVVDESDNIIFGASFLGPEVRDTIAIGRLSGSDGSVDGSFGDNGFFVRSFEFRRFTPQFELGPSGVVIAANSSENPTVLFLDDAGTVTNEVLLVPSETIESQEVLLAGELRADDLVIDEFGNVLVVSEIFTNPSGPQGIVQRVLADGQVDIGFGSLGVDVTRAGEIALDSEGRLIVAGRDLFRLNIE